MTVYLYIPNDQAHDVLAWGRHLRVTTAHGAELLDAEQGTTAWVVTGPTPAVHLREVVGDGERRYLPAFVFCEVVPDDVGPDHQHACTKWPAWDHEGKAWAIASVAIPADRAEPLAPLPFVEPVPVTITPVSDSTEIQRWQVTAPVVDGVDTLETSRQVAVKTLENHEKSLSADLVAFGKHQPWAKTRAQWLLSALAAKVAPWALMRLAEYDMNYWFLAIGAEPMPASGGAMQPRRCWRLGGLSGLELCGHPVGTNCSDVGCLKTGAMTRDELLVAQGFQQLRRKPLTVNDPHGWDRVPIPPSPILEAAGALQPVIEPDEHFAKVNRAIDVDKLREAIGARASSLAKVAADIAVSRRDAAGVSAVGGEVKALLWVLETIAAMTEEF